jgi:hypothetical protein
MPDAGVPAEKLHGKLHKSKYREKLHGTQDSKRRKLQPGAAGK